MIATAMKRDTVKQEAKPVRCTSLKSHELLREVFEKANVKQLAENLGLSRFMIYKWAQLPGDEGGSGTTNPLDRVQALLQQTQDQRIVEWLCECAGGFFVKNPQNASANNSNVTSDASDLIQEFAAIIALVSEVAKDGKITKEEAKRTRTLWEELKSKTETFVNSCDRGVFGEPAKLPKRH